MSEQGGYCQMFSASMAEMVRLLGIPARYVCGYIYTGNVGEHRASSDATHAWVSLETADGLLRVAVRDDGQGGANTAGSGLVGLRDRVEALGGRIEITSPRGAGTTITIELPL